MKINRAMSIICILGFCFKFVIAQDRPFLFTVVPSSDATTRQLSLQYDAVYGRETFEPIGGDNVEQKIGMQTSLNESITLVGKIGFAMNNISTNSSQHIELLTQLLKSQDSKIDLSIGSGFLHEYRGTNVLFGRVIVGRRFESWQLFGNVLVEKPFSQTRDQLDLFLTTGLSYNYSPSIQLGIEAVGQDLEGFWDETEAEGGATMFIGPTMVAAIPATSWTFTLGVGPIIRATQNIWTSIAPRYFNATKDNGYIIHGAINIVM